MLALAAVHDTVLQESEDNMALSLDPTFSYQKGQVWLLEQALTKMLAQQANADAQQTRAAEKIRNYQACVLVSAIVSFPVSSLVR